MKHDLKTKNFERKAKRVYAVLACTAMVMMVTAVPALAADDLKSHDPSQRANGMLTVAGGIVITFTKEILNLITG